MANELGEKERADHVQWAHQRRIEREPRDLQRGDEHQDLAQGHDRARRGCQVNPAGHQDGEHQGGRDGAIEHAHTGRRLAGLSPFGRATPGRAHQQREPEEERDLGSDHPSLPLDELAELGAAGRGGVANAVGQLGDGAGELSDLPQGHAVSLQESPGDAPLKRSHTLQHGLAPGHLLRGPIL